MNANIIRNAIAGSLFGYALASFACFLYLDTRWKDLAPRSPNLALQLYLKHNEHGGIFYFSPFQATSCALLFAMYIPVGFLSALIIPKKNIQFRTGFITTGATWQEDDPHHVARPALMVGAAAAPFLIYFVGGPLVAWLNSIGVIISLG